MQRIPTIARVLLALPFLLFGVNYFVPFLPQPTDIPPAAMAFAGAFASSGLMTFIKVIELASALALLANRGVPLALTLLAPIIVGITGFHAALEPSGLPIAVGLVVLELVLAWSYRGAFASMLRVRVDADPFVPVAARRMDRAARTA